MLYNHRSFCVIFCCFLYVYSLSQPLELAIGPDQFVVIDESAISNNAMILACVDDNSPIPIGGTISLPSGLQDTTICAGDAQTDFLDILLVNASGESFWIVTDTNGNIVFITTDEPDVLNFNESVSGQFQIWHGSYTGMLSGVVLGQHISGIDGCVDLSNPISIEVNLVDGGNISTPNGATGITICVGDGIPDILTFSNTSASASTYTYLVTDSNNLLLAILGNNPTDFDNVGTGNCRIYGVSHLGIPSQEFTILAGQDVTQVPIAECFDLSDNFIELIRLSGEDCVSTFPCTAEGGVLSINGDQSPTSVCIGDGISDVIEFAVHSSVGTGGIFLATDDQDILLDIFGTNVIDFESLNPNVCNLYHLTFIDMISNVITFNNINDFEGCYSLSNPIQVKNSCINRFNKETATESLTELSAQDLSSCDLTISLDIPQDTFFCADIGLQVIDVEVTQLGTTFTCPIEVDISDPSGFCIVEPEAIPTMSEWGLIHLTLLLSIFGVSAINERNIYVCTKLNEGCDVFVG